MIKKIDSEHPNYKEFINNEFKTLETITTRAMLLRIYPVLSNSISTCYEICKGKQKKNTLSSINFHCSFDVNVQGSSHTIILGALVTEGYEECSYSLTILGKDDDEKRVIRKYHFDYAIPAVAAKKQKVPSYHLQYGGELSEAMKKDGLCDKKLDSWLSVPRLSYYPINFALLLDLLLCEFRSKETNEVAQSTNWRDLIFNNEKFISQPFFTTISNYIGSESYKRGRLIRDVFYGE